MGAFQSGFQMGMSAYNSAQDRELRAKQEERAQRESDARLAEGAERLTSLKRQNQVEADVDRMTTELNGAPARDLAGPEPEGMDRQAAGLRIPEQPAMQGAARWDQLGRIAARRGDMQGVATAEAQSKGAKLEDAQIKFGTEFDDILKSGRAPEVISRMNKFDGIPLYMSKPGKNGMATVMVDDTGTAVQLNPAEQRALYVAIRTASIDPAGAQKVMLAAGDKLRALAKDMNDTLFKVTDANNNAAYRGASLDNDGKRLDLERQRVGLQSEGLKLQRERAAHDDAVGKLGAVQYFRNEQTGEVKGFVPTMTKSGFKLEPFDSPQGWKPHQRGDGLKIDANGNVVKDGRLFVPDPKVPGKFLPAQGLEPSALDRAIERDLAGQGGGAGPQASAVPGRPLMNVDSAELEKVAARPRGVSPAEAAEAMRELQLRRGEPRMSGF